MEEVRKVEVEFLRAEIERLKEDFRATVVVKDDLINKYKDNAAMWCEKYKKMSALVDTLQKRLTSQ